MADTRSNREKKELSALEKFRLLKISMDKKKTKNPEENKENSISRHNRTAPSDSALGTSVLSMSANPMSVSAYEPERKDDKPDNASKRPLEESRNELPPSGSRLSRSRAKTREDEAYPVPRALSCATPSSHFHSSLRASSSTSCLDNRRFTVNGKEYIQLRQLGKGGSSSVFEVLAEDSRTLALKVVDLSEADDYVKNAYLNEIGLLESLQDSKKHIVELIDSQLTGDTLYVLMEKGEVDLSTFLRTRKHEIGSSFIRYHWEEMLRCVKVIHDKNIVHSDLKPANFLLVKGSLKLIDFGIASSIPSNKTSVVKEHQMGTISYMSPECIVGEEEEEESGGGKNKYKVPLKSDVWSLGCILYNMVYGRTPFDGYRNQMAKMNAIANPKVAIEYPPCDDPLLVDAIKKCLVREVSLRASVDDLLRHRYLTGSPDSPLGDDDITQYAEKMASCTPRTNAKMLKEFAKRAKEAGSRHKLVLD